MEHIGIDLGSKQSHICVWTDSGIAEEKRIQTSKLKLWLSERPASRVVIETCAEAFTISEWIQDSGHEPWVVPAAVVRQLGVGYRGVKNDVRDARVLSKSSVALGDELPRVHIPSRKSRERQRLLTQRDGLVRARTQLVNGVRSQLRSELLSCRAGTTKALPQRVRDLLTDGPQSLREILEPTLTAIEALTSSIENLEAQLKEQTKNEPQIRLLKTMPGVGLLTAVSFASAVDALQRFKSSAHLASYFGLTPGEHTTGGKQRLTPITKAGKGQVRTLLIQAAWCLVRVAPQSALAQWYDEARHRRPKQVAIVGVARKMVRVLYAMMRDQKPFNPKLGHARRPRLEARQEELRQVLGHTA